ncbi:MAG: hypothetical protein LBK99_05680 [Opitutaceae bacterium]|jgi:hypothetical protein|nr:hypothetical protein [Opitutaceae bacterium]
MKMKWTWSRLREDKERLLRLLEEMNTMRSRDMERISVLEADVHAARSERNDLFDQLHKRSIRVSMERRPEMNNAQVIAAITESRDSLAVKAIVQLLDSAAVRAANESNLPPHPEYSETQRTFSAGGAYALLMFRSELDEYLQN